MLLQDIFKALNTLAPAAVWSYEGNTASLGNIQWHSTDIARPTDLEITNEIFRIESERASTEYIRQRQAAYPPVEDYLDAVVKGDQIQMQAYIDACLAVKAQYPKP